RARASDAAGGDADRRGAVRRAAPDVPVVGDDGVEPASGLDPGHRAVQPRQLGSGCRADGDLAADRLVARRLAGRAARGARARGQARSVLEAEPRRWTRCGRAVAEKYSGEEEPAWRDEAGDPVQGQDVRLPVRIAVGSEWGRLDAAARDLTAHLSERQQAAG